MIVSIITKILYLGAVFALLTKNTEARDDKANAIQVAPFSIQTVEQAPLQSSEYNFHELIHMSVGKLAHWNMPRDSNCKL